MRGIAHNSCNVNFKVNKCLVNVFIHNSKNYDTHIILSHANPEKHGRISCIPRTCEQYVSFRIGNLIFKDSMQFMNKSLDGLVSTLEKSELHMTSTFLKNYTNRITKDPTILNAANLGLYNPEVPGETFEIAKVKMKKNQRMNEDEDGPRSAKQPRCDLVDDEVEVDADDDEDTIDFTIDFTKRQTVCGFLKNEFTKRRTVCGFFLNPDLP